MTDMKTKHTPGPWRVGKDATVYGPRLSIDDTGRVIGEFQVCDCKGYKCEREANAKLIAACPELLAALEDAEWLLRNLAINWKEAGSMKDSALRSANDAREAISKAQP